MADPIVCPQCGAAFPSPLPSAVSSAEQGWREPQHDDIEDAPLAAIRSAPDYEGDADDPGYTPPVALSKLRVDDSVDPLHLHDPEAHASTHHTGLPGDFPSESFLEGSSELSEFLSQAEVSAPPDAPQAPFAPLPAESLTTRNGQEKAVSLPLSPSDSREETTRSAWPIALLASYASVMTLAVIWLWWSGQKPGAPAPPRSIEAETRGVAEDGLGLRESDSMRLDRPEEVPLDRIVSLGQPLRLGDLEVTPLDISAVRVDLVRIRVDGQTERRDGGRDALRLRLLLKNRSSDSQFVPLDEAFVRDPDRRMPDSFIELSTGERIYSYPLPARSEWAITGQEFPVLRPGESIEGFVFSAGNAYGRLQGPMTWRVRLRVGPGQIQSIGVRFDQADVLRLGDEAKDESSAL